MSNPLYDRLFGKYSGNTSVFLTLPDGRTISYSQFLGLAAQMAHALTDCGLQPGDRVAAQVTKSAEALALYAACAQAGFVFLPLNTGYTAAELAYFVEDSGAKALVGDASKWTALDPIAKSCNAQLLTLNGDATGSLMERAVGFATEFDTAHRQADDLAALLYTSGTTGRSKGAMLTQSNLLTNAEALVDLWRFTDQDVLLHALPIFHTHGLFVASNTCLLAGSQMILLPKFDLDQVLENLPKATSMMGVPTFYTRLLGDDRFTKDRVGHMRLFTSGSAPLLAETHVQFEQRTGHRILERYGMTETNMSTSNPYDGDRRAGTVGFALPDVAIRIVDKDTGDLCPVDEIGQLEVKGPNVFSGYWNMPDKTAAEFRPDGFFMTGDLAKIDADGYVHIVGRSKDLIISGGYNIYPKELELVLDEQAGVLESAVVAAPHPDFGESPVAVLVPETGVTLDVSVIERAVSAELASFKRPKTYVILPELPRNTMGKVQKNILREDYKNVFGK